MKNPILYFLALASLAGLLSAGTGKVSRVLVLHSYHHGFTWSDNISAGIKEVFAGREQKTELLFEYLDSRRIHTQDYFAAVTCLLKEKYTDRRPDVIIACDDHAFSFIINRDDTLFNGVPMVFCSVSGYMPEMRKGRRLTGLRESIDIGATLETALRFHPRTKTVYVVTDMTRTGRALRAKAEPVFAGFKDRLSFEYLEHLTVDELYQKTAALPADALVLQFIFSKDSRGHVFSHEEVLQELAKNCPAPIYALWEFYLGSGIVGGKLTSGSKEGRMAARMALRILDGEKAEDIPLASSPTSFAFDYGQLARFGITGGDLPDHSRVINRPYSVYRTYRGQFIALVCIILVLVTIVVIMHLQVLRTNRMKSELEESEARFRETSRLFETLFDTIPDILGLQGPDHSLIRYNTAGYRFLKTTSEKIKGKKCFNMIDRDVPCEKCATAEVYKTLKPAKIEKYVPEMGAWFDVRAYPILNTSGKLEMVIEHLRDISEQKRAEQALRDSEERYRSFLQNFQGIAYRADLADNSAAFFHGAVREITGYTEADFKRNSPRWEDIILPEDFAGMREGWQRLAAEPGYSTEREYRIRRKDGGTVWIYELAQNICVGGKPPTHIQGALYDVTDRKNAEEQIRASLREKETLLQEVHHRVKNNLQVISSLLSLQSRYIRDKRDLEIFNDSRSRVRSMALIHEQLYRTDNFASIDFGTYITTIARELYRTYGADPDRIVLKADIGKVSIGLSQAIPCGLIINELISNALKYAFPGQDPEGGISVAVREEAGETGPCLTLTVADTGPGLPEDVTLDNSSSLGLYLVKLLTEEQLDGSLALDRKNGTTFTIRFDTAPDA